MVTITEINKFNNVLTINGLSTDVKPIGTFNFYGVDYTIKNSSSFYEMDSKSVFLYDEENQRWLEQ